MLVLAGSIVVALVETSARPASQPAADLKSQPNLLFMIADQLVYQSCGFAGDVRAQTPQLDGHGDQRVAHEHQPCVLGAGAGPVPTLLGMADLPIPAKVEGADLSHCAFGKPGPEPEAAFMVNTGACAAWEDGYEWRASQSKRYNYAI